MTVGIIGLGLIGGSMAKAYKKEGHRVLAYNRNSSVTDFAVIDGAVDEKLDEKNIEECELILICIYPEAAISFMEEHAEHIAKDAIVIDCCGTKRVVYSHLIESAHKYGFTYIGGHPMAGNQYSGYKYAKADLFKGAPMVLVPEDRNDIKLLGKVKEVLSPVGFGSIEVTSAEKHDEMIAFTSQLAHVVSNAYIKSPTAVEHKGFSAGSYKDMTRVAWLNPKMWAELFLENKDNLIKEIEILQSNLAHYIEALKEDDEDKLIKILEEGKKRKEEVDG